MKGKICKPHSTRLCGESIDVGDIALGGEKSNLVYLDKVFSYNSTGNCPLPFNLNTMCGRNNFDIVYEAEDHRSSCSCETCILDGSSKFIIESATATLDLIRTKPQGNVSPSQVSIDGEPVDSVTFSNHRYTVDAADIVAAGQKQRCIDLNQPTRFFFLIQNVGPWKFFATYVLKGLVNSHGRTCRFKATISNTEDSPSIICNDCSSFAIPNIALPCSKNGIYPSISFQFSGKIKMVNPKLSVRCQPLGPVPSHKETACNPDQKLLPANPCNPCNPCPPSPTTSNYSLALNSNLIIEPSVQLEVVRKTLFCVDGREVLLPCDQDTSVEEEEICYEKPSICEQDNCSCKTKGDGNRTRSCKGSKSAFQYHGSNGCSW